MHMMVVKKEILTNGQYCRFINIDMLNKSLKI